MGKMKEEDIKQQNADLDDPMRIWNRVCKTDVDHTKQVSFGRKFTAIDAHSQIMEATRVFGPVGTGWGYSNEFGTIDTGREIFVYCDVTIWYTEYHTWEGMPAPKNAKTFGPIRGMACLQGLDKSDKPKPADHDAAKKAMTDAITKGLSHLGFNADVFLGQFDDNKYVQELKAEKNAAASAKELAYQQDRAKFIDAIKACSKAEQMDAVLENYKLWMAGLPVSVATEMRSWVMQQKAKLTD